MKTNNIMESMKNVDLTSLQESASLFFEKIKTDSKFQKKGGICLAIIVGLLAGTHFVDAYQQGTIKSVSEKQAKYEEIQKYLEKHNNSAMDYKEDVSKINGKILNESEVDKANAVISKLAETNGVTITNNKKTAKSENIGNNIFTQKTSLEVTGEYGNILNFINAMENESFFASCETLSLGSAARNEAKTPNTVSAKLDYKIFFVKDKSDKNKADKADKKDKKDKADKKDSGNKK